MTNYTKWKWKEIIIAIIRRFFEFFFLPAVRQSYGKILEIFLSIRNSKNLEIIIFQPSPADGGIEGIPRKKQEELAKSNEKPQKYVEPKQELEEISERIDIYYFDHGNSALV